MVAPLPHFVRNWFYGTMLLAGCQYWGMGNKTTPYLLSLNLGVLICLLAIHVFKPDMMPEALRDAVAAPVPVPAAAAGQTEKDSRKKK
ncbi:hypothetical protein NQZ79_g6927 [Umbelopsis isabellina]|nr:hypothetical protein NQZ79_g6927 [Umbelopsis isabellina]